MTGITMSGGWFLVLPNDKHASTPNDRKNQFLYRSNNATSYFFGNFKNKKMSIAIFIIRVKMVGRLIGKILKLKAISVFGHEKI
jgi:hypothetical protein